MVGVEGQLLTLLYLFGIAAVVGIVTARYTQFQYTTGLLVAGLLVSLVGSPVDVELTSDVVLLALLPALVFNDAIDVDVDSFRENLVPILALAVVGLLCSITLVAVVGQQLFGFPLAIAVLFAAIVTPTDPVSVLVVFDDLGVPERLRTLVEGESLLNDGVSIVVYSTVLGVLIQAESQGVAPAQIFTYGSIVGDIGLGIVVALVGGALVGGAVGYVAAEVVARVDDELTAVVLSFLVAYGVYLLLDLLGSSGVVGTLTAGVFLASGLHRPAVSPETDVTVSAVWGYGAFVANTLLFVALGIVTPFDLLVEYAPGILAAVVLVFVARAVVVYPLVGLLNRWLSTPISLGYQHVLTWSGIHASVSVALVLGVAETFSGPLVEELSALVFGVAAFTLLVNGPTMGRVVEAVGIEGRRPSERLYEALVGRLQAVDAGIGAAEQLLADDEITPGVFDDLVAGYERERAELERALAALLDANPDIRAHEARLGQHRILVAETEAIEAAVRRGAVGEDVGERLLADVAADRDRLRDDEWVPGPGDPTRPGDRPYWRAQLEKVGVDGLTEPVDAGDGMSDETTDSSRGSTR